MSSKRKQWVVIALTTMSPTSKILGTVKSVHGVSSAARKAMERAAGGGLYMVVETTGSYAPGDTFYRGDLHDKYVQFSAINERFKG